MASVERPLSPHLQVYRPQWTSVLSISHRATGVVLSVGAVVLVWWLAAAAGSPAYYESFQGIAGSALGQLALFVWTLCLMYHFCNGLRHLMWDSGRGLELEQARKTGQYVVIAAAALTVVCWIAAYAAM